MSENNGTALGSRDDAPVTGLSAWLENVDDTTPLDVVDKVPAAAAELTAEASRPVGGDGAAGGLDQLRGELACETQMARLRMQRHTAQLGELSGREQKAERKAVEHLRKMQRDQQLSSAKSKLRRQKRATRAANQEADQQAKDTLWQRRALAKRMRLLDSTSRLASLHRTHVLASVVLIGMAAAGIAWTAKGVHDALVGPTGSPLAYVVEPLFSVPLVVIMLFQARAAQWGRHFPIGRDKENPAEAERRRRRIYLLEAALLFSTILVNTSPVLPVLGTWQDTTTLLAHLAPPALILVAVSLHPMVSSFVADLMVSAYVEPTDNETRLNDSEQATALLARQIEEDWQADRLRESPTGGPSIRHAMQVYGVEKVKVQRAVDLWACVYG